MPETYTEDQYNELKAKADAEAAALKTANEELAAIKKEKEDKEKADKENTGKFEELYKTEKQKADELEAKFTDVNTKYTSLETAVRDNLIESLPETHREFAKTLDTDKLTAYEKLHRKESGVEVDDGKGADVKLKAPPADAKLSQYTTAELEAFEKKFPGTIARLTKNEYPNSRI